MNIIHQLCLYSSSFVPYLVTIWEYGKPWVPLSWWNLKGPAPFVAGTLGSSMPAHCSKGPLWSIGRCCEHVVTKKRSGLKIKWLRKILEEDKGLKERTMYVSISYVHANFSQTSDTLNSWFPRMLLLPITSTFAS